MFSIHMTSVSGWDESQITSENLAKITLEMQDAIGETEEVEPEKSHTVGKFFFKGLSSKNGQKLLSEDDTVPQF